MSLSDMKVFNDFAYSAMTETIDQQVRLFNDASNNAIMLQSASNVGDYKQEAMFAAIAGLVRRRNAAGSGAVAPVDLGQLQHNSVKVAGGTVPVRWEPQQFSWIQRNQEEAGTMLGVQLAEGMFQDKLNAAIASLVAAITANTNTAYVAGAASDITLSDLVAGSALFGDRAPQLRAWVIHSKPMHDLYAESLANGGRLFEFGNVAIQQDGFGRRFIITDSPGLITGGTTYSTLGLTQGAALVEDNGDFFANMETNNGGENIERTWQAEYTFNLGLKGYSWDVANGGRSPTDTALATGTNWDKIATSDKDTAGVLVQST